VQIKELPDMHRTVAEQEEEIRELEDRIRRQRDVLEGLGDVGLATQREKDDRADLMET